MRYTFDKDAEAGSRVVSVDVKTGEGFEPLDPEAVYSVATNNYMRGGGDGYAIFRTAGMNAYDYGPGLEQVVADYLAANAPYTPYTDGRIVAAAAEPMTEEAPAEEASTEEAAPAEETAPTADVVVEVPEPLPGVTDLTTSAPMIAEEAPAADEMKSEETEMAKDDAMAGKQHVITAGDTLWDLAKTYYGDATMWEKIAEANPSVESGDLTIGETLTIPAM
jgi:5'-nucleotidase/UDP-sugar diphosphatase